MRFRFAVQVVALVIAPLCAGAATTQEEVQAGIAAQYPSLEAFYRDLHTHPELSLQEERTSGRVAAELRACGFEVTEKFGGTGVVGVLHNGPGPTLMIRAELDALPVKEETGLPYASTARMVNLSGTE